MLLQRLCLLGVVILATGRCTTARHEQPRMIVLINRSGCSLKLFYIDNRERHLQETSIENGSIHKSSSYYGHEFEVQEIADGERCTNRTAVFRVNKKYYQQIVAIQEGMEVTNTFPVSLSLDSKSGNKDQDENLRDITLINKSGCHVNVNFINPVDDTRVVVEEGVMDGTTRKSEGYVGLEFEVVPVWNNETCADRNATFQVNQYFGQTVTIEKGLELKLHDDSVDTTPFGMLRLNSDFSLFPHVNSLDHPSELHTNARRLRWQRTLFRQSPAAAILENKLLCHSLLMSMGIPTPKIYYGAFATKAMGEWPQYDRDDFIETLQSIPQVAEDHLFVLKPATGSNGFGTIVMNHEKWVRDGWTLEELANHVEGIFDLRYSQWGSQYEHLGVLIQQSVLPQGNNADFNQGSFDADTPVFEAKMHVVFGKLTTGSFNLVPLNPGVCLTLCFCTGDLLLSHATGNKGATEEFWEAFEPAFPAKRLSQVAERIAFVFGVDMYRLDVFMDANGMFLVNEVTYPSGEHPDARCTYPWLFRAYQDAVFDIVDPRSVLDVLLQRINVPYETYIGTSDFQLMDTFSEEEYDARLPTYFSGHIDYSENIYDGWNEDGDDVEEEDEEYEEEEEEDEDEDEDDYEEDEEEDEEDDEEYDEDEDDEDSNEAGEEAEDHVGDFVRKELKVFGKRVQFVLAQLLGRKDIEASKINY